MSLPENARDWMLRAEIDYIGPFVKAWAAFNAWYRKASEAPRERLMLDYVKYQPNPVRRNILPLLDSDDFTAEGAELKQAVYDLHHDLDRIQFEVIHKGSNERISLRSVCINTKPLEPRQIEYRRHKYKVRKVPGATIEITVTPAQKDEPRFRHQQEEYNPREVYESPEFTQDLTRTQRDKLREFYDSCNPRPMRDLVHGDGPELEIVSMYFRCTPEDLFHGLIETIYAMRNALLHGETDPAENVLKCYEPAYRIVMQFLICV